MRGSLSMIAVLGVVCAIVCACNTVQGPIPPLPQTYYSPYTSTGELAEWAARAVQQGVGNQLYPDVAALPDNRVKTCRSDVWKVNKTRKADKVIAERSANQCGGWDFIAQTSDKSFQTADALAVDLFTHAGSPQYAQALASAMMVYPELRTKYYIANYGGWREQIKIK